MTDAERYLAKAAECEAAAGATSLAEERASFLGLAMNFRTLAAHADRHAHPAASPTGAPARSTHS
jgi:hypothetical protein